MPRGGISHHGNIGDSKTETFNLEVKDGVVHIELFLDEPNHKWDFIRFSDEVGKFAQMLLKTKKKIEPNIHKYEVDVSTLPLKCILCGEKINDDDFVYEDYYIVFRGFTPNAVKGFVCFNCISEDKPLKRGECPYCHKRLNHPKIKEV